MKMKFRFETNMLKIRTAAVTRTLQLLGEGESEIKNQGRFDRSQKSFSQETEGNESASAKEWRKRTSLRELSAGCTNSLAQPPQFFSSVFSVKEKIQNWIESTTEKIKTALKPLTEPKPALIPVPSSRPSRSR